MGHERDPTVVIALRMILSLVEYLDGGVFPLLRYFYCPPDEQERFVDFPSNGSIMEAPAQIASRGYRPVPLIPH